MGILNVTPDSFYDGGKYTGDKNILNQVEKMLQDGATFIDIGGQSSKPNAAIVTVNEELKRVVPIVGLIIKQFPKAILSIDTFNSKIAQECVENGVAIINDISAGNLDERMFETVAKLQVPYIMMHLRGNPQTMQTLTDYDNLVKDILFYFSEKVAKARSFGINDLIIDPGFGFAKTTTQNFELLNKLDLFQMLELPILADRKSVV